MDDDSPGVSKIGHMPDRSRLSMNISCLYPSSDRKGDHAATTILQIYLCHIVLRMACETRITTFDRGCPSNFGDQCIIAVPLHPERQGAQQAEKVCVKETDILRSRIREPCAVS